jgi:hypothetical protein
MALSTETSNGRARRCLALPAQELDRFLLNQQRQSGRPPPQDRGTFIRKCRWNHQGHQGHQEKANLRNRSRDLPANREFLVTFVILVVQKNGQAVNFRHCGKTWNHQGHKGHEEEVKLRKVSRFPLVEF